MTPRKLSCSVVQKRLARLTKPSVCCAFRGSATCLSPLTQKGPSLFACTKAPLSLSSMFSFFTGQADGSSMCDPATETHFSTPSSLYFIPCLEQQELSEVECSLPSQQGLKGLLPCDPSSWAGLWVAFQIHRESNLSPAGSSVTFNQKYLITNL